MTRVHRSGPAARRGAVLGLGSQVVRQVLSIIATIVIARLLTPADFGIVAAANTLLGLAVIGTTLGFAPAVIRREHLDEEFLGTMFWTSLGVSCAAAGMMAALSPWLAIAFGQPEAAPYLAVLAPALILDVCASIPLALLQRRLRFAALYGVLTAAMVVYVAVQVVLAALGFGAWAVILGQLAMSVTSLVGGFTLARWRPRLHFSTTTVRAELGFAGGILLGQLLSYGLKSADYWVVGRTLGGAMLGVYYVAFQLPSILRLRMSAVSRQVLFPVFVKERDDYTRTAHIYTSSMRLQIGLLVPAMVGLAALSAPVMSVFFGGQWEAGVGPMRWLALAAVFEVITSPAGSIAIAHGRLRPYLGSLGCRLVLMLIALAIAARSDGGLEAFAIAMAVQSAAGAVVTQLVVARPLGLPWGSVVRPFATSAGPAAVMFGALVWLQSAFPDVAAIVVLLALVPLGAIVHVGLLWAVSRREVRFLRAQTVQLFGSVSRRRT